MGQQGLMKLNYLEENEVIELYELFFGKILIKKPDFSYINNLTSSLTKESFVKSVIEKLTPQEIDVLKELSANIFVPYDFIAEKLHIILKIPTNIINKAISNLLLKKIIFLRNNTTLVIPHIYFPQEEKTIKYSLISESELKNYHSKTLIDINNLINYFISKDLTFSNANAVYKKDGVTIEDIFLNYSSLKRLEYNYISHFFCAAFRDKTGNINLDNIKSYFNLPEVEKSLFFVRFTFPEAYAILTHFYSFEKDIRIDMEELKKLWLTSFLLTNYVTTPLKLDINNILHFLKELNLVQIDNNTIIINYFTKDSIYEKMDVRVTSNFNLYINANSNDKDFYIPALFADMIKYNKIVEYEITESSIKRGILFGFSFDFFINYLKQININLSANVEATIKQWFDKYNSFFYITGTLFFCETEEKARIIKTIIENKVIKAYEVKKNEIFLIPEEEKLSFFNFLTKSGINYYQKDLTKEQEIISPQIINLTKHLDFFNEE
ncbi:MAG: hypothetical protein A2086_13735 [Spirochaetes bacterium GWD1_27_9]|nr:MAG: hypothetical protein A2Z98_13170 [Spirochaetes bacterium GWB1_27_13]OHD25617.1 MAG: hypothetical protein A2Y34_08595 [Spirochaetes bacterium GWC1_27_15]OHD42227.1 MAG: hypothetical protein A2086_13735 [Spirochaetes bacterium GWD1_27_9]